MSERTFQADFDRVQRALSETGEYREEFFREVSAFTLRQARHLTMDFRPIPEELAEDITGEFMADLLNKLLARYKGDISLELFLHLRLRQGFLPYLERLGLRRRSPRLSEKQIAAKERHDEVMKAYCEAYCGYLNFLTELEQYFIVQFYCAREPLLLLAERRSIPYGEVRKIKMNAVRVIHDKMGLSQRMPGRRAARLQSVFGQLEK